MIAHPTGKSQVSFKEKRSEFIGILIPVNSASTVAKELKYYRKTYYDSRHVAWAYRRGENGNVIENSSDDGEPSGSAGSPILGALRKKNIVNAACFVVRYFGGVKLGKRGLIDAYRTSAELAIHAGKFKPWIPTTVIQIECDYKYAGNISRIFEKNNWHILKDHSEEKLIWDVQVHRENTEQFMEEIKSTAEGKAHCRIKGRE